MVIFPTGRRVIRTTIAPAELAYEACFLAGLKKLDQYTEPHRPYKVLYSSHVCQRDAVVRGGYLGAVRAPDGSAAELSVAVRRRWTKGAGLFPQEQEIREGWPRLPASTAT